MGRTGTFIAIDMLATYIRGLLESGEKNGLMKIKKGEGNGALMQEAVYENLTDAGKSILLENRATLSKISANVDIFKTILWLRSQRSMSVQRDVSLEIKKLPILVGSFGVEAITFQLTPSTNRFSQTSSLRKQ